MRAAGPPGTDDLAVLTVHPRAAGGSGVVGPPDATPAADGAELDLSFPPRRVAAGRLRTSLSSYLARHAVPAACAQQAVLCAEEAFTNALRHGGDVNGAISVSARLVGRELILEVRDQGCGFDASALDLEAVPDPLAVGGRGLYLIWHLADEVEIVSHGNGAPVGTTVRMRLHVGVPVAASA